MGRKDSARGPFAERCFLVGPFRSAASADAPLYREASSSSLVQMDVGLSALQLRFLVTSCLAGVCVTDLAAGWRVLVRPSNILTQIHLLFRLAAYYYRRLGAGLGSPRTPLKCD